MTTMDQIHRIRELFYEQGKNLNEIAIIMNCDWRTVHKYVDMEDFSSPPPAPIRGMRSITPNLILSSYRLTAGWKRISLPHENSATLQKGSTSAWKAKIKISPAATDWSLFMSNNGKKN